MRSERMVDVLNNGYNMTIVAISARHIVINIGGSYREMRLDIPLSVQINKARLDLGDTAMYVTDGLRIDAAQADFLR